MHALVAAVLLRVARLDALDLDAEPEPPDREPGEIEQGIGACERHAIVGADGIGKAKLLEDAFEHREGISFFGCGESLAGDEIAGGEVADRERIAIALVCEHELALVIGAPQVVRLKGLGKRRAFAQLASVPAAATDQTMTVEHGMHRADRGQMDIGIKPSEPFADLRCAPGRLVLPEAHDQLFDLHRKLIGLPVGPARAVRQRLKAAVIVPVSNLVAGFARDAEFPAEARHRIAVQ